MAAATIKSRPAMAVTRTRTFPTSADCASEAPSPARADARALRTHHTIGRAVVWPGHIRAAGGRALASGP